MERAPINAIPELGFFRLTWLKPRSISAFGYSKQALRIVGCQLNVSKGLVLSKSWSCLAHFPFITFQTSSTATFFLCVNIAI